jgi:hypothetical protein
MSLFAGATRDELRQAYADAWRKRNAGQLLTPLEAMIADVIALHPDVHALVEAPPPVGAAIPAGTDPAENPYLHMGLHIAVREQVSIDRPPGVRELRSRLEARYGNHAAEHQLMQALAETLRQAQQSGQAPSEALYLELARRRL